MAWRLGAGGGAGEPGEGGVCGSIEGQVRDD